MLRRLPLLVLSAVLAAGAEPSATERVRAEVKRIATAVIHEDSASILSLTHPKAIEASGGRAALEAALPQFFAQLRQLNARLLNFEIPADPVFHKGADREFVLVPTRIVMRLSGKKVDSLGFQLGVRARGDPQFRYIDGSKLSREIVLEWFPDFPKEVELPGKENKVTSEESS